MSGSKASLSGVLTFHGERPRPSAELIRAGSNVKDLRTVTRHDGYNMKLTPAVTLNVLQSGFWRRFADTDTWEEFTYSDFESFVKAPPPGGLALSGGVAQLRGMCAAYEKDPEAHDKAVEVLGELDKMVRPEPEQQFGKGKAGPGRGNKTDSNGIRFSAEQGNRRTYTLARLKRDRPDLAERVVKRELSANAAAVEAGFRPRMVQIPATLEGFARAAMQHLSANDREQLAHRWMEGLHEKS